MKEQYVGDVSDYRKYAILRGLAQAGRLKVGVHWMLTPPDGRSDGRKISYLSEPGSWRHYDPPLFDILCRVVHSDGARSIAELEAAGVVPAAVYFNELVPDDLEQRQRTFRRSLALLDSADVLFFDPDNGVDVPSVKKGRKNSNKYLYRDEVAGAFRCGHSLLIYQHYPYKARDSFTFGLLSELVALTGCPWAVALSTPHVVFMLLGQARHRADLEDGVRSLERQPPGLVKVACRLPAMMPES